MHNEKLEKVVQSMCEKENREISRWGKVCRDERKGCGKRGAEKNCETNGNFLK